jgi:hypothetical protein
MTLTTGLEKARIARQAMSAAGIKVVIKNPMEKLATAPTSLRLAINAKCYQCEGEDADPGVKRRIGTCEIQSCALWAVRPYQRG